MSAIGLLIILKSFMYIPSGDK